MAHCPTLTLGNPCVANISVMVFCVIGFTLFMFSKGLILQFLKLNSILECSVIGNIICTIFASNGKCNICYLP